MVDAFICFLKTPFKSKKEDIQGIFSPYLLIVPQKLLVLIVDFFSEISFYCE